MEFNSGFAEVGGTPDVMTNAATVSEMIIPLNIFIVLYLLKCCAT